MSSPSLPQSQGVPTLKPAYPFNPKQDAGALHTAMKGLGTDEKTIIQVLCKRTNTQRQVIAVEFNAMYKKDLVKALKSELSGDFENLIVALMTPKAKYQAKELHRAMSGIRTNERALVELLCTATNQELRDMNAAYKKLYNATLESDLNMYTIDIMGALRTLLDSICKCRRNDDLEMDQKAAVDEAKLLLGSKSDPGTAENQFITILSTCSYPQLKQIFKEYERMSGHAIELDIETAFSGDLQSALLAIVQSVRDKAGFFAEQLYKSMIGLGTWDRTLIRIVSLRSEIDLEDVKNAFNKKYQKSLAEFVEDDTSGDFKKGLLALIK